MNSRQRKDQPGAIWHITGRVNWQVWHLHAPEAYRLFIGCLRRAMEQYSVRLLAYVVMSNHYHLVAQSPDGEEFQRLTSRRTPCRHRRSWPHWHPKSSVIGQFMHMLKLSASKALLGQLELTGHLWEGEHHRRLLRDAWSVITATAYDHRNPVRAGMVARPEEYERSSAAWWLGAGFGDVPIEVPAIDGLSELELRDRLVRLQREKRLDDVMEVFARTRLRPDSPKGRRRLEQLMEAAGLDPLHRGSAAARPRT